MPCEKHAKESRSKDGCLACLVGELVTFREVGPTRKSNQLYADLMGLGKQLAKVSVDLDSEDGVLLQLLVAEANGVALKVDKSLKNLLKLDLGGGGLFVPYDTTQFDARHRRGYRAYVARMGTWLGMSELQVLSKRFHISFKVYFKATKTFYDLGTFTNRDYTIIGHCLVFTGNHWEVGVLQQPSLDAVASIIQTNPFGNCCIEAFLTLLSVEYKFGPASSHHRVWTWVDQFRVLRGTHCTGASSNNAVPSVHADPITQLVRNLLKTGMTSDEVDDALAAIPGLRLSKESHESTSKPLVSKSGSGEKWERYVDHIKTYFELTSALSCQVDAKASFVLVTNITQIDSASLLGKHGQKAARMLEVTSSRVGRSVDVVELGKTESRMLTHLGFMVARVVCAGKTTYFMSVMANFAAGRRTLASPYMVTGGKALSMEKVEGLGKSNKVGSGPESDLFSAYDMHTECYSYFLLDRFIQLQLKPKSLEDLTEISVDFVLQLDMCDRCAKAQDFFQLKYGKACQHAKSFSVESESTVEGVVIKDFIAHVDWKTERDDWKPFK